MPQIESIEATRPINGGDWLDSVKNMAHESFGVNLDFHHAALRRQEVVLLGQEEWLRMHKITGRLGGLSVEQAEETSALVHDNMPASFDDNTTLEPYKIDIEKRDTPKGVERVLVVKSSSEPIKRERKSATKTVDEAFDYKHPWDKPATQFDIAVITAGFINNKNLAKLRAAIPRRVEAEPGKIEPVTIDLLPNTPLTIQ